MNWGYLYDLLHDLPNVVEVQLAHPFRTRIIAEAQIKTDKIDSRWLAELLRVGLIAQSHASSKEARRRKELLRQRCFFVRKRTAIRNRVHVLLGSQRDLVMPQVSDIFGVKGMSALKKLQLAEPHERLLLDQDLAMLAAIKEQVKSAEKAIAGELKEDPTFQLLTSVPGLGPILAAVIASEIDGIERFRSSKKLLGYAGLVPSTASSGGKTRQGGMLRACNKWLKWAFVEAAWVAVGCDAYFGGIYRSLKARGKKPNLAITIVAKRMAEIVYRILIEQRPFSPMPLPSTSSPKTLSPVALYID